MLWQVWLVVLAAEVLLFFLFKPSEECSRIYYFYLFIIRPSGLQFLTLLGYRFHNLKKAERYSRRARDLGTVCVLSIFVAIMVCVHTSLDTMPMLLLMPMLMIPLYKERLVALLQGAIIVAVYLLDILFFIPTSPYMPTNSALTETIAFATTIAGAYRVLDLVKAFIFRKEDRSKRDSLTNLYNHERFYEELEYRQRKFAEEKTTFSIAIADIDNFKKVNDTHGHAFGDIVIKQVCKICVENGGTEMFCARYGGEEFAMIFPEKNKKEAVMIVDKIRRKFSEHGFETEEGVKHFTISIGVAECDKVYSSASSFFEKADQALYRAKSEGKNCVRL